jgi:hypothetical protein
MKVTDFLYLQNQIQLHPQSYTLDTEIAMFLPNGTP